VIYLLALLLFSVAHAADLRAQTVECEPQRVHDKRYWSYRIVDGRACWYPGRPGKPKTELRWSRHAPSKSRVQTNEAERPGDVLSLPQAIPSAAPAAVEPEEPLPEATLPPGLTTDALLAFAEREQLRKQAPLIPIAALPQQEVVESMSIWKMTFIVLSIIGAISLIPIYKGVRNG
jgi:hypothetical protein